MLPAGLLGDRYGRKKVMLLSLALFAAGSLACVYSKTSGQFIAARILLGFAGAGLIVMAISALTVIYPSPPVVGQQPAAEYRPYRVLPVVGGLLVGLMPAAPIAKAIGAKLTAVRWLPGDRHRPGGSALLRRRHRARASSRRGWR